MNEGAIVAERFVVERRAGSGGTGTVFRALDRLTGEHVALKFLHDGPAQRADRFLAEARALSELRHPGIVRYVSHGVTDRREPFLAMEWLEGEDLARRIERALIDVSDGVHVVLRVAEALGQAHLRGIVHRDVKPSNIFLVDGDLSRVKLLDFGVARVASLGGSTRPGALVGTPGYMAPEQARGAKDLDARADIFSLGCVLFECLTSRPPFSGEHVMAVLAKILLEEAPRVRDLRSAVPAALDALVASMLAKAPDARPADAAAVVRALASLGVDEGAPARPASVYPASLTGGERPLLSVLLASGAVRARPSIVPGVEAAPDAAATLREVVAPFGGVLEPLADGSIVVTLRGSGAATDQAAQVARAALALRAELGGVPMAIAMGRGELHGGWPTGEMIDRAAGLLRAEALAVTPPRDGRPIRLDHVVAGLLDSRFEIIGDALGQGLLAESHRDDWTRTLLGKACPCVGREREIASLVAMAVESASEPVARVGLVTGPPGVGKSRLLQEVILRLRAAGSTPQLWLAQGDPMSAGAPFVLVSQIVRRAAGLLEGEPLAVRQGKLRARVGRGVRPVDVDRIAAFLGEIVGAPFPDGGDGQLRAARRDAMLMGDQIRRAWTDWVRGEAVEPLLFVIDDLQWGDLPSVRLIDAALEALRDRPVTVFALARPEIEDTFGQLWTGRGTTALRLGPLSRKSSAGLVTTVLGARIAPEAVASLVERAAGNPFYLEELIRAAAEGGERAQPDTVRAMVDARLDRLSADKRRVLRAASVFGQAFWTGGVASLLGVAAQELRDVLEALGADELIALRPSSAILGEREYRFRHSLLREGAYASLTEPDRVLGHRLAAAWLVGAGALAPLILAEHFERGASPREAVEAYRRAVEQALEGNDLVGVLSRVARAVACGATGEELGSLRLASAMAHRWRGEFHEAAKDASEAVAAARPHSSVWLGALGEGVTAGSKIGDVDRVVSFSRALLDRGREVAESDAAYVIAATRTATNLFFAGRIEDGQSLLERAESLVGPLAPDDPNVEGWAEVAFATRAEFAGDPAGYLAHTALASASFVRAGDVRAACTQRINLGYASLEMGAFAEAEHALRDAARAAEELGLWNLVAVAKHNLGRAVAWRGAREEGARIEGEAVAAFEAQGDLRMAGASRMYLAQIHGSTEDAEREARLAMAALEKSPPVLAYARATLADVLLRRGQAAAALALATSANDALEALGGIEEGESFVRLVHAKALAVAGDASRARAAIDASRARLLVRAARIAVASQRGTFLEAIPENRETFALATAWGLPSALEGEVGAPREIAALAGTR